MCLFLFKSEHLIIDGKALYPAYDIFGTQVSEIKTDEEETDLNKKIKEEIENSKTNKNIAQKIKETLEYKYPFEETTNLPT